MIQASLYGCTPQSLIDRALRRSWSAFCGIGVFSGVINLLALTGSFYMLQIYDRVLPSRSIPTLVGLSILMGILYIGNGLLEFFRVRVMSRVGMRIDNDIRQKVFEAVRLLPLKTRASSDGLQAVRDLDQIRSFFSGIGPATLFDLPWIPVYLALVFFLHPLLGLFSLCGGLLLISLTLLTEFQTRKSIMSASASGAKRLAFGEEARRNAEVIHAMGLGERMAQRWERLNDSYLADQTAAADAASGLGTVSKIMRFFLQSGILGLGAYLAIQGQVSAGAIIAASIIMSRSLAPIETAIAHWRSFVAARLAHRRLTDLFNSFNYENLGSMVALPAPRSTLTVHKLSVIPPGEQRPVIVGVSFTVSAGDGLGIIGPSASGKSTLARAILGIWKPMLMGGSVRLDGATLDQWTPETLGRHIGYLPQDVALFEGSIGDNIARFDPDAKSEDIVAAAKTAGVHDMIVQLPCGYQTAVGEGGAGLSAGQRQRIALARALYGDPFLVVLDEPNSNLDAAGDAALTEAIKSVRGRGGIAIVIAHRPSALAAVDQVLAIARGQVQSFGPKAEVLAKISQQAPRPAEASPIRAEHSPAPVTPEAGIATGYVLPGLKIVADRTTGGV